MKALSIKQPWASLIAHGIKNIENRTWKTKFRGRIFIHASAKSVQIHKYLSEEQLNVLRNRKEPWDITHLCAIIGEVDIIDCVINHPSIWADKLEYCPITGQKYWGDIISESGKIDRVYGGPYDSFTIPEIDEDGDYYYERYCQDEAEWKETIYLDKSLINKSYKPIYNWVLSNAVLYDKPILNVKGKLSFWETDYCHCEVCQKPFHYEAMVLSEDNWICEECLNEELSKISEL